MIAEILLPFGGIAFIGALLVVGVILYFAERSASVQNARNS